MGLFAKQCAPKGASEFESLAFRMRKSREEIISLIRICLASAKKQKAEAGENAPSEYINGYIEACEFILKESGEDKDKKDKVQIY